jgi:hypothetical protein
MSFAPPAPTASEEDAASTRELQHDPDPNFNDVYRFIATLRANNAASAPPLPARDALTSSRTNAVLHARRLTARYRLGSYSQELESFADEDAASRSLLTFAKLISIDMKISALSVPSAGFLVDKPLMVHIIAGVQNLHSRVYGSCVG